MATAGAGFSSSISPSAQRRCHQRGQKIKSTGRQSFKPAAKPHASRVNRNALAHSPIRTRICKGRTATDSCSVKVESLLALSHCRSCGEARRPTRNPGRLASRDCRLKGALDGIDFRLDFCAQQPASLGAGDVLRLPGLPIGDLLRVHWLRLREFGDRGICLELLLLGGELLLQGRNLGLRLGKRQLRLPEGYDLRPCLALRQRVYAAGLDCACGGVCRAQHGGIARDHRSKARGHQDDGKGAPHYAYSERWEYLK